ncbi:hypothetical protein J9303_10725 [Bacillaceae bacterium Marseille-Q3522]|nr:hypothetical protein [Bacillaceae bacterium Marseille-Q3522]
MAFGIKKADIEEWKEKVSKGDLAFLTHYWLDARFPGCKTVTKAGCKDMKKLIAWGNENGLKQEWIHHHKDYPHFDLFGNHQLFILQKYQQYEQIERFKLE